MQPLTLKVTGALVYLTGACASYADINRKAIHAPIIISNTSGQQNLGSSIMSCTHVSYHHAKNYYHNRVNPIVYSAAWPIIQFTMVSASIFTGTLCGTLEWHDKNK
jgi:hypothetical protein